MSSNINFLNHHANKEKPGQNSEKKSWRSKFFFYPLVFFAIFLAIFTFQIIITGDNITDNLDKINIFGLSLGGEKSLKGETDDRINILLLGMGGKGHDGPYLTDTMILVAIKPSENKVAMISIPRDLAANIPGYGWHKINYANSFGEIKTPGKGGELASEVVGKVFDQPVDYYVRIDFAGFQNLIDELGGIKIEVDTAFTDSQFPVENISTDNVADTNGYKTISFNSGWQEMDGQTALNFVRSRHGSNGEDSDFARSKRQQKVLAAIKDKAFSFSTFLSYSKVNALLSFYKNHVATNLSTWEIFKLAKMAKKIDKSNISNAVLDDSANGLLYATNINGAYLLFPKDTSYYQIQQLAKNIFETGKTATAKAQEKIKVEVQNGTKIEGLAYKISADLKNKGYNVVKMGNCKKQNFQKTVIYDLSGGKEPDALADLKTKLNANVATDKPEWLIADSSNKAEFLIVLGQDQEASLSKLIQE